MTKPRTTKSTTPTPPPTQLAVPIGPQVIEVLELAYRARRPILLEGPTGIGKSQIVGELARTLGIGLVVLDLSLLEPPDLVGLPVISNGRTHYASPAELPTSGHGVLMLEELNRAEVPVMQPALQLLSARRLHAYELPPGWICVAAVNPEDGDYQVNRLDPALRSRFLQLSVCADRDAWLGWATHMNVHPVIARVVRDHDDAFAHASPRSWTYASDVLHAMRAEDVANGQLLRVALRGYLPSAWALVVADAVAAVRVLPRIELATLCSEPDRLARLVRELESSKRIDAVAMLASQLRRALAGDELTALVESGALTLTLLDMRLSPLLGDLREQCLDAAAASPAAIALLRGLGHDPARIAAGYVGSPLALEVAGWRRDLRVSRIRLVIAATLRWLAHATIEWDERSVASFTALAADAGPIGEPLARWLRTRGLA